MRAWLFALVCCGLLCTRARADEASARQHFDVGVAAAAQGRWEEASAQLEASLVESDKPATRYNLVLAYEALRQPVEVVRHALAFLAFPDSPGREPARQRSEELLQAARAELAAIDTSEAPSGAWLRVQGFRNSVIDGAFVRALPGKRVVQVRLDATHAETLEIELRAGVTLSWSDITLLDSRASSPITAAARPAPAVQPAQSRGAADAQRMAREPPPRSSARRRTAWSLGILGAALSVATTACMWVTVQRANELSEGGLEGTQETGYLTTADRYEQSFSAVAPLAAGAGGLMAAAIPLSERIARRRSLGWSIASLAVGVALLGASAYFVVREPDSLIPTTDLNHPSRQAGSMLLIGALPLISYGAVTLIRPRRAVHVALRGVSSLHVAW